MNKTINYISTKGKEFEIITTLQPQINTFITISFSIHSNNSKSQQFCIKLPHPLYETKKNELRETDITTLLTNLGLIQIKIALEKGEKLTEFVLNSYEPGNFSNVELERLKIVLLNIRKNPK